MSNHSRVVLRIRPDLFEARCDEEIARRWLRLCPPRNLVKGRPIEPKEQDLNRIRSVPDRVAELRRRLVSVSWFMHCFLDWTGRQLRAGKRGTIPDHRAPILERLWINGDGWLETVRHFGRRFKRAVGRADSRASAARAAAGAGFKARRRADRIPVIAWLGAVRRNACSLSVPR